MVFAPTPGEVALTNQIFALGDPDKHGILTGERAVGIFNGAGLDPAVLGDIWGIVDDSDQGFLTKKTCAMALRLIGWAQQGEEPSVQLFDKGSSNLQPEQREIHIYGLPVGPLPVIQGVPTPQLQAQPLASPTRGAPSAILTSPLPPLTATDRSKFLQLFNATGPAAGFLSSTSVPVMQ